MKSTNKPIKILLQGQDPGGIDALRPVIEKLKQDKRFTFNFGGNPDIIFTSTSLGKSIDKQAVKTAKLNNIKSVAIVDFWSNYKQRFDQIPDYILVIDEIMKQEMIDQGFDKDKLVITGSPCFDALYGLADKQHPENFIVFFSQPFSEIPTINYGFNEIDVLRDFLEALKGIGIEQEVKIKLHPKAKNKDKFGLPVEDTLSTKELREQARLVLGMNSRALFDACLLGKKVLSYQPSLPKERDPLISNRIGLSTAVYNKQDLAPLLKELYFNEPFKSNRDLIEKYTNNNSTQRVISFIYNYVKSE